MIDINSDSVPDHLILDAAGGKIMLTRDSLDHLRSEARKHGLTEMQMWERLVDQQQPTG